MDEILVLKQDQAEAYQIVSNAYTDHNPTGALQISTIFNCYGPRGGCVVNHACDHSMMFSHWTKTSAITRESNSITNY
jgi:hypothetical protein